MASRVLLRQSVESPGVNLTRGNLFFVDFLAIEIPAELRLNSSVNISSEICCREMKGQKFLRMKSRPRTTGASAARGWRERRQGKRGKPS